ncbi:unnamed protein product [Linum tenue]|uniref:BOP1 N-terminal domain-containing protein n=2 Tax=Linum TaxID=4005 RepID=A0AAV0KYS8_9ROSI|nr:unnamed protein product [Linum tenue]
MGVSAPPKEADRLKTTVDENARISDEFDSEGEASEGSELSEVATEEGGGSSGDEDASTSDGSGLDDDDEGEKGGSGEEAEARGSSSDDEDASATDNDGLDSVEGSGDSDSERSRVFEESDSSEDELLEIQLEMFPWSGTRMSHILDMTLKGRITKKERQDKLDSFLANVDDSKNWRKIYDDYNDEDVELTKEEAKMISRLLNGKAPHAEFDPYAPYVDWFKWDDAIHPLSNAPEPKRRFIPSKWEAKKVFVVKYVRAIRKGLIKFDKPKEEPRFYMLWGDDSGAADKTNHLSYIPAQSQSYQGPVVSISTEVSGEWIASGSTDGTVRIWEVESGRCRKVWQFDEAVHYVAWNPMPELPILAVSVGQDAYLLNTGVGNEETQRKLGELLYVEAAKVSDDSNNPICSWIQDDEHGGIKLRHAKTVSSVEWHRKGDYFSTIMPADILFLLLFSLAIFRLYASAFYVALTCLSRESKSVMIHQLSKKLTQRLPFKLKGIAVSSVFHPTRSIFFAVTKKNVRVYDLLKQKLIKKLETGLREVSSIAIHPGGDNVILGSREGKLCWFDMDLSSKPYKILKSHSKDVTNVAFHRSYPLFASSSDDGTAYVFHGMVYSDLNQNPLIVPLEILRGHTTFNGRGVMDCKFHPRQPWLFTAGADSSIKLYCHN